MTDKIKQIPNVECLKYHGTNDKPDIKVFVSNRIDQDSITIDNPLYIPIRCGAVFDKRENLNMLGDNTGENISEKRDSFCELTVQYWAWKNVKADYYGLCHYRRFLTFENCKNEKKDIFESYNESRINISSIEKYGLTENKMEKIIPDFDIITSIPMDFKNDKNLNKINVLESIKRNPTTFDFTTVEKFIQIATKKYPELGQYVKDYFSGKIWRGFNCYIMKKEIFFDYNDKLFSILFELEREINLDALNQEQLRTIGYMGEAFWGIYYNYLKGLKKYKTKEVNIVKFLNTGKKETLEPAFSTKNVPIILASSNEYTPFLSVVLTSIRENSSINSNYDIIVINNKISEYNKYLLKSIISDNNNFSLRFIDAETYLQGHTFYVRDHITPMTYLRLAILDFLGSYEKVIYLDCDIAVNKDIAELFSINISNYLIAGARDTIMAGWCSVADNPQIKYNKEKIGLKNPIDYFNAGIILLNIEKLKKEYSSEYLFKLAESENWKWFDQDILNKVCNNQILFLDNKWNVLVHLNSDERQLAEFYAPKKIYDYYKSALKDPYIVHYAGNCIPCYMPSVPCAAIFWKYARLSPFYEQIINMNVYQTQELNIRLYRAEFKIKRFEHILGISFARKLQQLYRTYIKKRI